MSGIFLSGFGAVSPAGWGLEKLLCALRTGESPATQTLERPGWTRPLIVRRVPAPNPRPAWAAHARMRRAAAISQFAMGAAEEALGSSTGGPLGIVYCTTCGCVNYSRRFYNEVLRDPAVASPLLFPETVFNAPASHLSSVLGTSAANYTLVSDTGVFLHGLALAAGWLEAGRVERCLVVAAEEVDWIIADALRHFRKSAILAEGAGAVLLTRERTQDTCAELECVTDPEPFVATEVRRRMGERFVSSNPAPHLGGYGQAAREAALGRVAAALPAGSAATSESAPVGESFSASTAWQVLAAIRAAQEKRLSRATVLVPGAYQEAIGASFKMLHAAAT